MDFRGKTVAVVGMQKSGFGAASLLLRNGATVRGVDATPTDAMRVECVRLGIELRCQRAEDYKDIDLVVLSPAVPPSKWPSGLPVIGEVELASRYLRGRVIAVTGSNGKTTTTALIGHILEQSGIPAQVGGNIGIAPTAMVDSSREGQWNVLELSSFQLATISTFRVNIGVCMNVTQNHLDWHGSFEHYSGSKGKLFSNQTAEDWAVLNADDPICVSYAAQTPATAVWFSLENPCDGFWLEGDTIKSREGVLMRASEVRLRGRHNLQNVMAAAAATRLAGAAREQIRAAVMTFQGVEHRIEYVRTLRGVEYYNDSKATSVDATMKAIEAFDTPLWLILGGKDKGSNYMVLREPLRKKARSALLIGAAADKIAAHLGDAVRWEHCGNLATAVQVASSKADPGDTVLLAPACASFDQFRSFEHRGEVFKELVKALE